jgi:hypothetical protein
MQKARPDEFALPGIHQRALGLVRADMRMRADLPRNNQLAPCVDSAGGLSVPRLSDMDDAVVAHDNDAAFDHTVPVSVVGDDRAAADCDRIVFQSHCRFHQDCC